MAKQLNVNLAFTADTSKAKASLQDLQSQLNKLTSASALDFSGQWTKEMQEASVAAMELKTHLQNATNVQTGNLDFTKLNQSIKKSNTSIAEYGRQLLQLGPAGQQAFMSLASAVSQSEIPIRRSNTALKEMMVTLKNTARWQLSSSMLHGFMSAVQSAYGYAQDLNESLNNIRIVTGHNIDQMAKFAEQANKAAKALSTTTTDYTDASLIYYQQGLDESEVAKRTDVTIKMANAAGQSAQIVSDQLTSVWNNFYDGSKSLEYYADVMTALGAATASSTDEIAGGLEKFAAVADTIGLSYEYAASALATITSNTRQSEEVVGTALKTIFARIQGLNLGETLDDGTTLNKYSDALQKVGISIFEQNGEIKRMDDILDEMASKWQTLAKDQQIALAQTVAGVRQYNQLVSLMDNWNAGDSDSMMANLQTAYGSSGTLEKQADIYAESWEAAQDRVRAAAEGIYSSLIDEDFFIGALKGLEKILTYVDNLIDSLGGLKGVLSVVGVILTKTFSEQMANSLRNMAHNIYMSTEGGRQNVANQKIAEMRQMREDLSLGQDGTGSEVGLEASKQFEQQLKLQEQLMLNSHNMSEAEVANAQQLLDLRKQIGNEVVKAKQAEIDAKDKVADARDKAYIDMGAEADNNDGILGIETTQRFDELQQKMRLVGMSIGDVKAGLQSLDGTLDAAVNPEAVMQLRLAFNEGLGKELDMTEQEVKQFFDAIEQGGEEAEQALKGLLDKLSGKSGGIQGAMNKELGVGKTAAKQMAQGYEEMATSAYKYKTAAERAAEAQKLAAKRIAEAKGVVKDWANGLVSGAQAVMSFVSIVNAASGAIDTLTNPDATGWEKFMAVLQGGAMIMMMTVSMFNSLAKAQENWQKGTLKNAAATLIEAAATTLSTKANEKNARAQMKKAAGHNKDANAALKDAAATEIEGKVTEKNNNKQLKSNKKLGDSFKQLKEAGGQWFDAYKKQIGGTLLIAAAIATVVATISLAINQYNEAARDAENAAAAAEQLSEQYANAKTSYESFNNTVSGYNDAVKSMEELTKGTVEYNEAMLKANEYAMDLINKYDLIGKYSIQDGLIVFDDGVLEEARMKALDDLGKAQASQYMGQMAASHFAGQSNQTNFNRKINTSSDNGKNAGNTGITTAAGGIAGGLAATGGAMLAGATIGSTVPIVGTIIGAVVGLLAGVITTAVVGAESEKEDRTLDILTEFVEQNGDGVFAAKDIQEFKQMLSKTEIDINDDSLMQALYSNRDALRELTVAEVARLQKEEANWEAGFAAYNMSNSDYTGLEVGQGFLNEQSSHYREENIDRVRSEVDALWSGSNDDFWAQYLKYVYNQENIDEGNTSGENVRIRDLGGGAVTIEKMNAEGGWEVAGEKNGLDEDVAAEQLVNAILLEEASQKMDLGILHELTTNLINAGLTLEEDSALMDSVLTQYAEGGPIDLSNYSYKDITSIDISKIQDPNFQAAVDTAIKNYKDGLSEIEKALIDEGYNGLVGQNWTVQVDEHSTVDSTRAALDAAQSYINAHQLTATIQVKDQMISALESGDMATFKKLYNQSYFAKNMSYEDAIEMGTDELVNWIQNGGQDLSDAFNTTQQALADNTAAINAQNQLLSDANTAAYGEDGKSDGIGGSEQVYLEAAQAEEDAQVYSHETVVNTVGWTGAHSAFSNGVGNTGFNYVLGTNSGGAEVLDIGKTLGQWDTLFAGYLGPDSPLYTAYSQFTQDAIAYSNAESGSEEWYAMEEAMKTSWSALVEAMIDNEIKSGAWDDAIESQGEDAVRDSLRYSYSVRDYNAYAADGGWDTGNYSMGLNVINDILTAVFSAGENGYGQTNYLNAVSNRKTAQANFEEDKEAAGDTGAAQSNIDNLETERTTMLENLHIQQALMKQEVSEYGLDLEVYEELKREIANTNKELRGQEGILHNLAVAQLRAERGAKKMAEKQEDWKEVIESSNGEGADYLETVVDIRDAYADVFDLDPTIAENLSAEFLTSAENMDLMTEALNGNDEAWDTWKFKVADALVTDDMESQVSGIVDNTLNGVMQDIAEFNFEAEGIEIGASVEDTAFWQALDGMKIGSAEAAQAISEGLSSMGVDAKIVRHVQYADGSTQSYTASGDWFDPATGEVTPIDAEVEESRGEAVYTWYTLEGATYNGKGVSPPSGGDGGKGGGGGGSKPKKAKHKKKTDVVDRYKEITDSLDNNTKAMEDASRAADRLYGQDRLSKMREANKLLQKEIDLTKQKRKEAEAYLKEDRAELEKTMAEAGINFTFDATTGDITNYTEEMTKLYEQLDAKIQAANKDGNATEAEQEEIDAIQEKIDAVKDALNMYEETKELIEDLDTELEEKFNEWQDANFDILNTELELKIEINDMDLQRIEYYLGKIEDDFYQMAEAAALMVFDSNGSWGGQLTSYTDQLESQAQYLSDLEEKYRNNEISQASYIEGLKNASSAIYEQLGSLQELDATMMEYYSETLAAAGEEIAKYTDLMESASGVLEHYTSLAELMGKSTDYKYMGNILSSQAKVASDAYKVSKANYDMLKDQEADREKAYKDAYDALKASGATDEELANNAQLELLEKQWWDAQTATAEAQDQMLSDAEAWAEALGAILDNALSKAAQNLENTLADGFGSFDAMNSAFERKNALQEEYLTTTNKIYETNKLMRTAQQEIDKTTNEAAKRKLKQFINETDALQDQTKLSQYELEIQQMKYDLLLAEIALEEAQNAKSTVRLQRDNEGNMSYVYTADANKVADAQQKFEDAQNALYNKGLEGANDYVQKYQETMQEMYDTLTEIDQNYRDGAYESELEYQKAIEEAKEYYYKKLTQYSNLYQVALTTDTRVAADAWTTEFASMTERTGDWMTAVNGYINEVKKAFGEWKTGMDLIHTDTLANIDQDLQNIESDSGKLATTVTKELIPALGAEMDAVADITEKYATFREELEKITTEYEEMAKAAENAIKAANGLEDGTDSGNPGDGNENKQNNDEQESNPNNNNNNNGNITTYIVQVGDTLSDIGAKYGVSWQTIYEKNKNVIGNNPNLIFPGQVLQFASGGYTGSWAGSYGKLAFLHQKELILNQHDTENFLASMEILEHILQMIDLQATSAQLGGILTTPKFSHYNDGILEQNVHIEASFPGVTDHNEVELAMTNLINTASQYANRK